MEFFGGTGITLDKLKHIKPKINVDGTTYHIEDWLKECELFSRLEVGKTPIYVPYSGAQDYGILHEVVWDRYEFKHFGISEKYPETKDWWIAEPYLKVRFAGGLWYVYEVTFYKKWRRKTQLNHIDRVRARGKGKFLNRQDIIALKRTEVIENSVRKREKHARRSK